MKHTWNKSIFKQLLLAKTRFLWIEKLNKFHISHPVKNRLKCIKGLNIRPETLKNAMHFLEKDSNSKGNIFQDLTDMIT